MNKDYLKTPMGIIKITENQDTIVEISFAKEIPSDFFNCDDSLLIKTKKQLKEYFDGSRKTFDFPLSIKGTEFQKKVWNALQEIPYGETRSYKEIAEQIGSPNAARAVGLANNKNPLLLVIPCHRIVGSTGDLVGYVAGVDTKKKLLEMEKKNAIR